MNPSTLRRLHMTALAATATALLGACASAPVPVPAEPAVPAAATPTLLAARRAKSEPAMSHLTYQHMDKLFSVTRVHPSSGAAAITRGAPWSSESFRVRQGTREEGLEAFMERHRLNGMVVLRDGKLVKEVYRNGSDMKSQFIGYSMSKSVIAVLIGIAIDEGRIRSVDDPVVNYLTELKGSAYDGVTVRNLLMMRTGTDWKEIYTPDSELDRHRDLSLNESKAYYEDYALKSGKLLPPGTKFNYSTLDTNLAGWLLERAVGMPLARYMETRLWQPMGAETGAYWVDQGRADAPRPFYGAGMAASLRDWARVGQLALDAGHANGRQIVSAAWMKESTSKLNDLPGYGYFWWTYGAKGYGARGINGQAIYVQPETRTVIAVAGYWRDATDAVLGAERDSFFESVAAAVAAK